MQLTLCKHSALTMLRFLRTTNRSSNEKPSSRTDILYPDPSPQRRWTPKLVDGIDLGFPLRVEGKTLDIAVPDKPSRIYMKESTCTVYEKGIPDGAFIHTRISTDECTLAISGPELLFAELAKTMHPVEHLMLGHELCGTFSRDPLDPYNGPITYGIKPATSAERIRKFLAKARNILGIDAARTSAAYLNDNAWSPTESLIAALLRLPMDSLGFDFGELELNPRVFPGADLPGATESRVPDIVVAGTPVGINYDGATHLDLESIVDAARALEASPEVVQTQTSLANAVKDVRGKVVDDIRRNRELAANGLAVFPMVKEDLYEPGGLEQIVAHLITMIEQLTKRDMGPQKKILRLKRLANARRRMMLSLLPGNHERNVHIARFVYGHEMYEGPEEVYEYWIEL